MFLWDLMIFFKISVFSQSFLQPLYDYFLGILSNSCRTFIRVTLKNSPRTFPNDTPPFFPMMPSENMLNKSSKNCSKISLICPRNSKEICQILFEVIPETFLDIFQNDSLKISLIKYINSYKRQVFQSSLWLFWTLEKVLDKSLEKLIK